MSGYLLMFPFYGTSIQNMQAAEKIVHGASLCCSSPPCWAISASVPSAWKALSSNGDWCRRSQLGQGTHSLWLEEEKARTDGAAARRSRSPRLPNSRSEILQCCKSIVLVKSIMSTAALILSVHDARDHPTRLAALPLFDEPQGHRDNVPGVRDHRGS